MSSAMTGVLTMVTAKQQRRRERLKKAIKVIVEIVKFAVPVIKSARK